MTNRHRHSGSWNVFNITTGEIYDTEADDDPTVGRDITDTTGYSHFSNKFATDFERWSRAPRADWLLDLLRYRGLGSLNDRPLRLFAVWCAHQVLPLASAGTKGTPMCHSAVKVGEQYAGGRSTEADLESAWETLRPASAPAGSMGMRHRGAGAAAVLACWHTCNPQAFEAAKWAAFYATVATTWDACGKAGEYEARKEVHAFLGKWAKARGDVGLKAIDVEATVQDIWNPSWDEAAREVERDMLAEQAEKLRELLPNPFQ